MSLFSKAFKSIKKRIVPAAVGFLTGGPAGAAAALLGTVGGGRVIPSPQAGSVFTAAPQIIRPTGAVRQASIFGGITAGARVLGGAVKAGLPALRSLPGAGAVTGVASAAGGLIRKFPRSAKALRDLGLVAAGGFVFDAAGNLVGRRAPARRINPLNHRAAMRAARRIKAVHRVCKQIESCLPRRAASRSCAPAFVSGRKRRKC